MKQCLEPFKKSADVELQTHIDDMNAKSSFDLNAAIFGLLKASTNKLVLEYSPTESIGQTTA
jgi:hypothetical protein